MFEAAALATTLLIILCTVAHFDTHLISLRKLAKPAGVVRSHLFPLPDISIPQGGQAGCQRPANYIRQKSSSVVT